MPNNEMWHAHDDILSSHDKLMDAMADEHQNQKTSEGRMSNVDDLEFLYIDPDGKIVDTVDPVVSLTKESAMSGIVILRERCVNYNE